MGPSPGQGQAARGRPLGARWGLARAAATDARAVVLISEERLESSTVGGTSGCDSHIAFAARVGAAKLAPCVVWSGLTVTLRPPAKFGGEATNRVITTAASAASAVTCQ